MGIYIRLVDYCGEEQKKHEFFNKKNIFISDTKNFDEIPGNPFAYWLSSSFSKLFTGCTLHDVAHAYIGMRTGNNDRFLRLWYEINVCNAKFDSTDSTDALRSNKRWFPYNKGGEYRKWYGNQEYLVNWENDGFEIKQRTKEKYPQLGDNLGWKITNEKLYFQEGITWTVVTSKVCFRRYYKGFIFSNSGQSVITKDKSKIDYLLGILNSSVVEKALQTISPIIGFESGYVNMVPMTSKYEKEISEISNRCIQLSKSDWDSRETSWDFKFHPLIGKDMNILIEDRYNQWKHECDIRFNKLKENEEKINDLVIKAFSLDDEMDYHVSDDEVSVKHAELTTEIKNLISYSVGCMFGRYSLDIDGLVYAGGDWDDSKYKTYIPDDDNVIPILDEEYLEDDIVGRFVKFVKIVYGEKTLEENLTFIANAIGGKGKSSREVIRSYFLKDFFKDHCKTYQKRPIYWLYDSGKQNGFKALVYLHRMDENTTGKVRADYLHHIEQIYNNEVTRMQDVIDHSKSAHEVSMAEKRMEKLRKQIKECQDYDAKLGHLALDQIKLNLDDGVKINYRKAQTGRDGKFYEVLADSKNIMANDSLWKEYLTEWPHEDD